MSACAGIDFDTNAVHVCLLRNGSDNDVTYHRFDLHGHDAFERTRSISAALPLDAWWLAQDVIAIGIEEPMGPGHITAKLKAIQGGVLQCLPSSPLVHPLSPSQWRKAAGVSGGASKQQVQLHARELLGENPQWPQDAFDAYLLAIAVRNLISVA